MNKRTTRTKRSTRVAEEPSPRRRPRRVARKTEAEEAPSASPRRKRAGKVKKPIDAPKPPDVERRNKARKPPASTRVIHLAMSPNAANILRTMLGKARHDVPELEAIRLELEDQLSS